jgi:hypothetical protein
MPDRNDSVADIFSSPQPRPLWDGRTPEGPFPVWQFAGALVNLHGEDAICWAQGYMVSAVQQGKPDTVRYMKEVIAATIEMSRLAAYGEAIH